MIPDRRVPPITETEWLMMAPGETPDLSTDHMNAVLESIEQLPDDEREILEAYFYERASYSELAKRTERNKAYAWRKVHRILNKLEPQLRNNPVLIERYNLDSDND